jgi:hypothetical protein
MPKSHIHADYDVKRRGGKRSDYEPIHALMDDTKDAVSSNLHRVVTHNIWFVNNILPRVFGDTIINSDGKEVSVRDIGEGHLLLDFQHKYMPTLQDWVENMTFRTWMNNGAGPEMPSSAKPLYRGEADESSQQQQAEVLKAFIKD